MTDEEARRALLGHWRLVSCTAHGKDGTTSLPVGSEAVGEIIYTRDGQMTSQLMSGGADDPGTLPYHGYFGAFTVDAARGIVTHHVTAAWDREMVGTDQERRFTIYGDRLTLEADRGDWTAHVVWQQQRARLEKERTMTKDEAFNAFIGGWQLVSCTETRPDGMVTEPIGPRPVGQIMYSEDGHMTAHLLPGGEPRDPSWRDYIGYFGRFTIDPAKGVVTHHVVGASEADMIGTEQPREFQFEGNRLILQAERKEGRARITWERRDERG